MALKGFWKDKVDGVDDVVAKDINNIANATIQLEESVGDISESVDKIIEIQDNLISNSEVETALDDIIETQNELIGG